MKFLVGLVGAAAVVGIVILIAMAFAEDEGEETALTGATNTLGGVLGNNATQSSITTPTNRGGATRALEHARAQVDANLRNGQLPTMLLTVQSVLAVTPSGPHRPALVRLANDIGAAMNAGATFANDSLKFRYTETLKAWRRT